MHDFDVARLISGAYEAVGDVDRWPLVLDSYRSAFGADAAVQFSADAMPRTIKRTQIVSNRTIIGIDETLADLHAQFAPVSPVASVVTTIATGTIHPIYDLIPKAEFDRSFFYDHCVRPTDLTDALMGCLSPVGPDMTIVNFFKSGTAFEFTGRDREAADMAMLHLARIFRLNLRLESIGVDPRGLLSKVLDTISVGLICVDNTGSCIWANDRAKRLLESGDGLSVDRTRQIRGSTNHNGAALQRLFGDLHLGLPASCTLDRPSGRLPLSVVSTPYRADRGEEARSYLGLKARPIGTVAIHEPEALDEPSALRVLEGRLKDMFGLTAGEALVAVAIYQTPGLQTVADRLGISRATVQTHLRRVFGKLGISTQSELSRRVQALTVT